MSLNFKARSSGFLVDLESMEGACCAVGGECDYTTALDCYSTSGNRFFHNLQCSDIECNTGVCCNNGYCSKITEQLCIEQGGTYHSNTDCATKRCWEDDDTPPEACCFETTGACEDYHPARCSFFGGVPQGAGTSCATVTCFNQSAATGACCLGGMCYETGIGPDGNDYPQGFTSGDCAALGGNYGGAGSTCDLNSDFGGSWPCTFPLGAACFGENPHQGTIYCLDGITSDYALNVLGAAAWKEGETCANVQESGINGVPCKAAPEGACCTQEKQTISLFGPYLNQEVITGYQCTNISEAACNAYGISEWQGEDTICDGFDCCSASTEECNSTLGCCGIIGIRADGTTETIQRCAFEAAQDAGDPTGESEGNYYLPLLTCQERYNIAVQSNEYVDVVGSFGNNCSDLLPVTCDQTVDVYQYAFCIFQKNSRGEYVYTTCESGEVYNTGNIPSAPANAPADSIYSLTFGLVGGVEWALSGGDFCNYCSQANRMVVSACCFEDNCTTVINNTVMNDNGCPNGDLYINRQCNLDCATLPCCNDNSVSPVMCIAQENISILPDDKSKRQLIGQVSDCVDRETLSLANVDETTLLQYLDSLQYHDAGMGTIIETQRNCEDCAFDCGRGRGSCCFSGTPIHNLTQDECKIFGGLYAGCSGQPYDDIKDALTYSPPDINCADLEPPNTLNAPTMVRGVAVRQVNDMDRYRRGPFSDIEDVKKAVASDWKTNGWSNGEWKTDKLFWPQKPLVQIFWSPKP